jgi:hypothetical protein
MKKITETTERKWQCPYCGFLNDLSVNTCKKCGAIRNGDEVEKEITTNFEETTIESSEDSNPIIINRSSSKGILSIVLLLVLVFGTFLIVNKYHKSNATDKDQFTVISKQWEYIVSIGEFIEEKGITSYTHPPNGATNITTRQVQQENGWYKTEYTYDYQDWKVVRTERIEGEKDIPTFTEYTPKDGEKIMDISDANYTITVQSYTGKKTISISKNKWINIVVGNTYSESDF